MRIAVLDKVVISATGIDIDFSGFDCLGETKYFNNLSDPEEILCATDGIDVIVLNKVSLQADLIARLTDSVKLIVITATGYDNVDIKAASKRGIKICNVPGYGTNAVAQLVMLFILTCSTKLVAQIDYIRDKGWDKTAGLMLPMREVAGKTLGIVGLGEIGMAIAKLAMAFDMKIIAYNRTIKNIPGIEQVSLEELASRSDFISLNCALNKETQNLINTKFLSAMKSHAYLINAARGGLIDEKALIESLNQGKLAGAALDVLVDEPPAKDNPLLKMQNVLLTPHIGWAPVETRQRCIDISVANIENFFNGIKSNQLN
jgi:glycerate dehydrogenase